MTLDDLIALNDEIAALVRAGVPLEKGLNELSGDLPGRLGRFAKTLAERTARGESLPQALAHDADELPTAYRAVVEAGVRAGRLPAALEAVASSSRRLSETYRVTTVTSIYPMLVVLMTWLAFIFFTVSVAPRFAAMFADFRVPGQRFLAGLAQLGQVAWYWGPVLPAAIALVFAVWWIGHGKSHWAERLCGWMPWTRRMVRFANTATFLEILALLLENQTPLPESLILAGEASGDRRMLRRSQQMADAVQHGQTRLPEHHAAFPSLVNWLLLAAGRDGALLPAIRHAAAAYHRRARHQADLMRLFFPIFLTIVVAGGVMALYALVLFVPYTTMLRALAG